MLDEHSTWDRVEPHTRTDKLEQGLQARVADSLWLLARQWQTGEFRGEDAASPVHVSLELGWRRLERFKNNATPGPGAEQIPHGIPLEARVEAVDAHEGPGAIALSIEAGLQFVRRLADINDRTFWSSLRKAFRPSINTQQLQGLSERETHRLLLLIRRGIDGKLLFNTPIAQIVSMAPDGQQHIVKAALAQWRQEYATRFQTPGPSGETWIPEHLEHAFSVTTAEDKDEVVLTATEYPGGHLDWYSFDLSNKANKNDAAREGKMSSKTLQLLPVPLNYGGMPASRWWEFEEGTVYFGAIEGGPADIGRLCVAEYATVYSDDWFLLPARLPVNSVARVTRMRVLDTFGTAHRVLPVAYNDAKKARQSGNKDRPWAYFELTGDSSAEIELNGPPSRQEEAGLAPWLYLPPVLATSMHGESIERVSFLRDQGANMGWAIEAIIETPTGRPMQRRHQWALANPPVLPEEETRNPDAPWHYRLQTSVPPYWIPLIPEPASDKGSEIRLRRARMLAWNDIPQRWAKGPKSQLLLPHRPLWFYEEEIPQGGIEVTRHWQLARGTDGRLYLWMARHKRPGRGEPGSNLQFDQLIRE